jgi:hypothetical protein
MENQAGVRDGEGLFGPPNEPWSTRLTAIRETVEDIGKNLDWDDDWMPTVIVDAGKMPADLPNGDKTPEDQVGKPARLVIGLAGDFMKNDETKQWTANMMTMLALKVRATGMVFINVVWMVELKVDKLELPNDMTEDEWEQEAIAAARRVPPPSKHPERKEKLMLISAQYGGEDDGTKLGFADIKRQEGQHPKLENWQLHNGDGPVSKFIGRFPDAIREGLRMVWEVTAAEAQGGA